MSTDHTTAGPLVAELPQGDISYRAAGPRSSAHPPVVFVHGLLVDARLWEPVAERLASDGIRSYAPTLPLGSHQRPMNADADLSPQGIAALTRDFLEALDLSDVTIVGNDTGGAICQLMLGGDTSRIGGAVLTNCDAFGSFPPRGLAPLFHALRHPGLVACLAPALRSQSRTARPARLRAAQQRPARRRADQRLGPAAGRQGDPSRPRQVRQGRPAGPSPRRRPAGIGQFTGPVADPLGRRPDTVIPRRAGTAAERSFPHATFTTVPGAGRSCRSTGPPRSRTRSRRQPAGRYVPGPCSVSPSADGSGRGEPGRSRCLSS